MPQARVICIGHAALDRVYRIARFPPQPTKIRALEHIEVGGGMAANAAVTISRLGGKAELWSRVGDDTAGQSIRAGLKAEKVDTRYVHAFEDARSSTSAIIVDDRGERLIVGQRDAFTPSGTSWLPLERIAGCQAVLGDVRWLEALRATFAEARARGVPTVLDADLGAREVLGEILALTDYAVFSLPALREFAQGSDDAARLKGIKAPGMRHVGVTRGAEGYLWCAPGGEVRGQAGFAVDVVDTTGAGDAFHGAFALMIAEQQPVEDAVRTAMAVAALKCRRLGGRAGLPTRPELERFLAAEGRASG